MIFEASNVYKEDYNDNNIAPSPYDLTYEGALMFVYENECNYNAIMKSVGLSELKYYQETSGDLLVDEAASFKGFMDKVRAFFDQAIKAIISIAKKIAAVIGQYVRSDASFYKKYESTLKNKTVTNFKGYKFGDLTGKKIASVADMIAGVINRSTASDNPADSSDAAPFSADDIRGAVFGKSSPVTEKELRGIINELLYGNEKAEKVDLGTCSCSDALNYIKDTKQALKDVDTNRTKMTMAIGIMKEKLTGNEPKGDDKAEMAAYNKRQSIAFSLAKTATSAYTTYFNMLCKAVKDRNRQSKAICVKALSIKSEEAKKATGESSIYADIFDAVQIV